MKQQYGTQISQKAPSHRTSVTKNKSPYVYKTCLKMISLEI